MNTLFSKKQISDFYAAPIPEKLSQVFNDLFDLTVIAKISNNHMTFLFTNYDSENSKFLGFEVTGPEDDWKVGFPSLNFLKSKNQADCPDWEPFQQANPNFQQRPLRQVLEEDHNLPSKRIHKNIEELFNEPLFKPLWIKEFKDSITTKVVNPYSDKEVEDQSRFVLTVLSNLKYYRCYIQRPEYIEKLSGIRNYTQLQKMISDILKDELFERLDNGEYIDPTHLP